MAKGNVGFFTPRNINKLVPKKFPLKYKSSWELYFMNFLDKNNNVINWGYEVVKIPYLHPFKKKTSIYIPDFLVRYIDKFNNEIIELVEIKPTNEMIIESAKNKKQIASCILNRYKWDEALKWCERRGIKFRVLSEKDMFI